MEGFQTELDAMRQKIIDMEKKLTDEQMRRDDAIAKTEEGVARLRMILNDMATSSDVPPHSVGDPRSTLDARQKSWQVKKLLPALNTICDIVGELKFRSDEMWSKHMVNKTD